jgi:hypothetical protein
LRFRGRAPWHVGRTIVIGPIFGALRRCAI